MRLGRRRRNPSVIDAEIIDQPGPTVRAAPTPPPTVIVVPSEPLRRSRGGDNLKPGDPAANLLDEFVDALCRAIRRL
jgi:hypothetical protein